ncbi:hypothetical protein BDQ17DRAFT_1345061 [Cyathus striatus]|nr:hypothetical protein BDQ17DRAFT_1345061 [Cyathus striatus]
MLPNAVHSTPRALRNTISPSGFSPGRTSSKQNLGSRLDNRYIDAGYTITQTLAIPSNSGEAVQRGDMHGHTSRLASVSAPQGRTRLSRVVPATATVRIHPRSQHVLALHSSGGESVARALSSSAVRSLEIGPDVKSPFGTFTVRRGSRSSSASSVSITLTRSISPAFSVRHHSVISHQAGEQDEMHAVSCPPTPDIVPVYSSLLHGNRRRIPKDSIFHALKAARINKDRHAVNEALRQLRMVPNWTTYEYTQTIRSLVATRPKGESLAPILNVYNEMMQDSIKPNTRIHLSLLKVFLDRDFEVQCLETVLETRLKTYDLTGRLDTTDMNIDQKRLAELKKEIILLVTTDKNDRLDIGLYRLLLRSCAYHCNVDAAIHVFAYLEKRQDRLPSLDCYKYLLRAFINCDDIEGAEAVFQESIAACKEGRINAERQIYNIPEAFFKKNYLELWNQMVEGYFRVGLPEKATDLVDRMLQSKPGETYTPGGIPNLASSTFTVVINGFCQMGDVKSALSWFDKLLMQGRHKSFNVNIRLTDRILVLSANLKKIKGISKEIALDRLQLMLKVLDDSDVPSLYQIKVINEVAEGYIAHGAFVEMGDSLIHLKTVALQALKKAPESVRVVVLRKAQATAANIASLVYDKANTFGLTHTHKQVLELVRSYLAAKVDDSVPRIAADRWAVVLDALESLGRGALKKGTTNQAITGVLKEMISQGVKPEELPLTVQSRLIRFLTNQDGAKRLKAISVVNGDSFKKMLSNADQIHFKALKARSKYEEIYETEKPVIQRSKQLMIDAAQTKLVELALSRREDPSIIPLIAYEAFNKGLERGKAVPLEIVGHIIQGLGRLMEMDKVRHLYTVAQELLPNLPVDARHNAWFAIEDSMIIALADAGDIDSANVHRARILEQGGTPSADAYGTLILHARDTSDDSTNAMILFQESEVYSVIPNLHLYNSIISKLAKAHEAGYALELFQRMKFNKVQPSAVTYGAVIEVCASVGDAISAENLFTEMIREPDLQPEISLYNVMMQLYTTVKPSRERALYYFEKIQKDKVSPSAHTYKLMLDVYGSIEPIDVMRMEEVFRQIRKMPNIKVQGIHFASLINSYGCFQKDLQKAIEVYDSISVPEALDAAVFEAMFNVFAVHRCGDLISSYRKKMTKASWTGLGEFSNISMIGPLVLVLQAIT